MQLCSPPFTSSPMSSYNRCYGNSALTFKNGCYCIFRNIYFLLRKKWGTPSVFFFVFFFKWHTVLRATSLTLAFTFRSFRHSLGLDCNGIYNKKPVLNLMQFQLCDMSILWTLSALIKLKTEPIRRPSKFWYNPNSSQKHFSSFCVALQPLHSPYMLHRSAHVGTVLICSDAMLPARASQKHTAYAFKEENLTY